MVQNTNEFYSWQSTSATSVNSKHSTEAVTQSLEYGNLNVTDSRPLPHPHDDDDLVYSDNNDVSAD